EVVARARRGRCRRRPGRSVRGRTPRLARTQDASDRAEHGTAPHHLRRVPEHRGSNRARRSRHRPQGAWGSAAAAGPPRAWRAGRRSRASVRGRGTDPTVSRRGAPRPGCGERSRGPARRSRPRDRAGRRRAAGPPPGQGGDRVAGRLPRDRQTRSASAPAAGTAGGRPDRFQDLLRPLSRPDGRDRGRGRDHPVRGGVCGVAEGRGRHGQSLPPGPPLSLPEARPELGCAPGPSLHDEPPPGSPARWRRCSSGQATDHLRRSLRLHPPGGRAGAAGTFSSRRPDGRHPVLLRRRDVHRPAHRAGCGRHLSRAGKRGVGVSSRRGAPAQGPDHAGLRARPREPGGARSARPVGGRQAVPRIADQACGLDPGSARSLRGPRARSGRRVVCLEALVQRRRHSGRNGTPRKV
ncbi:MAG: NAD binding site, partial [uncultured Microvirga sp.]